MISLTLSEIAQALSARLQGDDRTIAGVSTDSRQINSGDLFIALKGPNFDAHHFIAEVVAKGAVAVVVEPPAPVFAVLSGAVSHAASIATAAKTLKNFMRIIGHPSGDV